MELENVFVPEGFWSGIFLDVAKGGEIVESFASGPIVGSGNRSAFFESADLFERERIAFDGGGGVSVSAAGILLERRNPGKFDGSFFDAFAQDDDFGDRVQKARTDGELRMIRHAISQV